MQKWRKRGGFWSLVCLTLALAAPALGAGYGDGVYRDAAQGYGDEVIVTVTVRGGRITELTAKNRNGNESEYFAKAVEGIGAAVVEKQGKDGVDAVAGATGTSESILTALDGLLEQMQATAGVSAGAGTGAENGSGGGTISGTAGSNSAPGPVDGSPSGGAGGSAAAETGRPAVTPRPTLDPAKAEWFSGLGGAANFRVGPGKDEQGVQVYSFNVTMASVLFDREGRIQDVQVDVYEVATPNYDGTSMPRFSGWPGKEGYNVTDTATGKVTGVSQQTEESLTQELAAWRTKRERGDDYGMNPQNDWHRQMDAYEQWMAGKTVAELRQWVERYTSPRNGRPVKLDSDNEEDQKLLQGLSQEEKDQLADVVSMATMSLSDSHGLILEAIEKAYENRTPVELEAGK